MEVNLAALMPAAWNPRSRPDPAGIEELANSIQEHGVIQPIVVRAVKSSNPAEIGSYQIVCGSRRVDAAERAGLITIPAVERAVDDQAAAEIAMAENIQDERMDPLDEAEGYHHTMTGTEPVGVNEIARRLGVSVSRVRRRLRLLDLVIDAKTMLVNGAITLAHADHLVRIPEGAQKEALHVCTTSTVFDDIEEPAPVGRLAEWIGKNVKTELDPEIIEDYFPEIVEEAVNDVVAVPTMLKLSASMQPGADMGDKKHGMIGVQELDRDRRRCSTVRARYRGSHRPRRTLPRGEGLREEGLPGPPPAAGEGAGQREEGESSRARLESRAGEARAGAARVGRRAPECRQGVHRAPEGEGTQAGRGACPQDRQHRTGRGVLRGCVRCRLEVRVPMRTSRWFWPAPSCPGGAGTRRRVA